MGTHLHIMPPRRPGQRAASGADARLVGLSERALRDLVPTRIFERGDTLHADVEGSEPEPYHVTVRARGDRLEATCECMVQARRGDAARGAATSGDDTRAPHRAGAARTVRHARSRATRRGARRPRAVAIRARRRSGAASCETVASRACARCVLTTTTAGPAFAVQPVASNGFAPPASVSAARMPNALGTGVERSTAHRGSSGTTTTGRTRRRALPRRNRARVRVPPRSAESLGQPARDERQALRRHAVAHVELAVREREREGA